jgi:Fis family transcriptional regulator, factor for inversion stimulation protein
VSDASNGALVAIAVARLFLIGPFSLPHAERVIVREQLESLIGMMVERGILLEEAVTEFEKKFIKRVLERQDGNQSRAAKVLGIHRNTLSRKVGEYKLDHAGHKRG